MSIENSNGSMEDRESIALYGIARVMAERSRLEGVFEEIAGRIEAIVPLDFASLMVLDAEPDMERVVGWYPKDAIAPELDQRYRRSRGRQILADQFRQGTEWDPTEFRGRAERRMLSAGIVLAWSMPLMDGDAYYGTVTFARREKRSFDERELRFMRAAAELVAAAAREEHAIWRAERERARSQLLNELTLLLNEGRPVEDLFSAMAGVLSKAVTFNSAGLMRTDERGVLRLVVADPPELQKIFDELRVEVGRVEIRAANRWLQFDPTEVPGEVGEPLAAAGLRMVSAVFLTHMSRTVGALVLSRTDRRPFSEDDHAFLALAATLMAQAIVNRDAMERELEESRAETAEQRVLATIAAISAEESAAHRMIDQLADTIARFVPGASCAFAVLDGDEVTVYRSNSSLLGGSTAMLGDLGKLTAPVTMGGDEEARLLEGCDWFAGATVHAVSVAPDRSAGALRGVLLVGSGERGWQFGEREERIVRTAAQFVGSALHTAHSMRRLERGRALLDLVVRSLSDGIVLLDVAGKAAFVNERGQRVMDLLRPHLFEPCQAPDEWDAESAAELLQALAGGTTATGEALLNIAGEARLHRYEIKQVDDDAYSRLLVFEDIEEERRRTIEHEEHQRQMAQTARLSALGELVGGVAHELNNPLTAILGFAELLMATDDSEPMRDDLLLIHKEAMRARNIVRDLLFLVRPGEVEREELKLQDVVGHIERLRQAAWRKQGIDARVYIAPDETTLTANEHQLTQVLLNLTTNAEQALATCENARLEIRAHFEGEYVVFEVEDNGPGMTPEVRERIWEPFYTTKPGIGTGLGLSLSRSIVQSHGGSISLESEPGRGTRFRVLIPRDGAVDAAENDDAQVNEGTKRVLVVDDEPSLRKVAQRLVESLGHRCDVAEGAEGAAALAGRYDYDLVLCDYRLATEVADDVVEAFNRVSPHLVARVVIATGATTDAGIGALAGAYGLTVLPKPYGIDEIAGLLRSMEEAA